MLVNFTFQFLAEMHQSFFYLTEKINTSLLHKLSLKCHLTKFSHIKQKLNTKISLNKYQKIQRSNNRPCIITV